MLEAREFSETSKTLQIPVPSTVRKRMTDNEGRQGKKRNRSE